MPTKQNKHLSEALGYVVMRKHHNEAYFEEVLGSIFRTCTNDELAAAADELFSRVSTEPVFKALTTELIVRIRESAPVRERR